MKMHFESFFFAGENNIVKKILGLGFFSLNGNFPKLCFIKLFVIFLSKRKNLKLRPSRVTLASCNEKNPFKNRESCPPTKNKCNDECNLD